ncbi:sodium-dependent transporter [Kordiimonas marina]|uniref:sodium-dependent transporter n=1 Tax=Kordiimonas marina TaxID=2872312 RepID=UPI00248BF178|nr:sodium-dependent transporter [Kordiimonas marina]MCJ9428292.1 sodium-dependent transporter [Kordiimonas marina]
MAGSSQHAQWSSRWAFLMAAVGSAVGLGNIWKFPYVAGQGGGGAFVLVYLICAFMIGAPCLIAELSLGRRGQMSPVNSMTKIASEEGRSKAWSLLGWSGIVGAFIIISFYSLVGGWVLAYIGKAAMGFTGWTAATSESTFNSFIAEPFEPIVYHFLFMAITVGIVARGVQGGLEKAVEVLMPALFIILILLVVYSGVTGNFDAAIKFLFEPNFHKLTVNNILSAMGLAFFSLSLAMGSMMTYGSYLPKSVNIPRSAFIITASDSMVALLAGLAIFPIVFGYPGLEASKGPGLVFVTLPIAFGQMPGGTIVGPLFFALLGVAAITSSISLLEPAVSYMEERMGWNRIKTTATMGFAAFALGIFSSLGQEGNVLANVHIFGLSIMDLKDYIASNILMPIGAMFMMIFVGWFVSRKAMMEELAIQDKSFRVWYFLVRYVCPIAIAVIFANIIYATITG